MGDRHIFSLKEEARQTSRRGRSHWTPESRLRKNPVTFTSSGAKDPFQDGEPAVKTDHATESGITERNPAQLPSATPTASASTAPQVSTSLASTTPQASCSRTPDIIPGNIPETPCEAGEKGTPPPPRESPEIVPASPASSYCSDDEVILFTGRNQGREKPNTMRPLAGEKARAHESQPETAASSRAPTLPEDGPPSSSIEDAGDGLEEGDSEGNPESDPEGDPEGGPDEVDEADGTAADYLASLLARGEHLTAENFLFRELGASDDEICFSDGASASFSFDSDFEVEAAVGWSSRRQKKRGGKYAPKGAKGKKGLKQPNPTDLFSQYPTGMTMDQVMEELEKFLLSSDEQQLSFPPLNKSFRKMLHEVARPLRLKSKSLGKGDTRRPVLYRTKATPMFDIGTFEAATSKITRRYWGPRSKPGAKRPPRAGGGSVYAGYKDGEVAGSSLPELGTGNRGRTMLEKMGWSTGMALGTLENKGILQPVPQVVKRSKAGLGQE